ncbi:MAG: glycoside hydrolase family 27 protein, partial [Oscillospiraceae bacterium]|nr:glycoside hydrolase family 27 protein [Oscillospiraceae bacterium]
MDKNAFAKTPPMGWNSWDCYGAAVNEEQLLGNAEYMAKHLKEFGWQYVVCDIQWYEPKAKDNDYNNFTELCMDEYSRLIPAENRFPSSKNGAGFKPIADKIHAMGLKFGIHIMRGIPRQAVHRNTKIMKDGKTARQIAHHFSVCPWNTDMYGIDPRLDGAQEYYDSIFELYASWGVDFVKVDDICVTEFRKWDNPYSASAEVEMIRKAIDKTGREIVLSLSPGPAEISVADHLCENANMWRLTGDFWDDWNQLLGMFDRCKLWEDIVREGCWPDCDMLPLGRISKNGMCHGEQNRYTKFTLDEQKTLMTLWCIFRSPLMFGGEMRENDEWTLSLITNPEV